MPRTSPRSAWGRLPLALSCVTCLLASPGQAQQAKKVVQ